MNTTTTFTCTLQEAVLLRFTHLEYEVRKRIVSLMVPGWQSYYVGFEAQNKPLARTIWINGKYKTLRALPIEQALELVKSLTPGVVAQLKSEYSDLVFDVEELKPRENETCDLYDEYTIDLQL